jgi:glucose/arabinose dehydrogenase
LWQIEPGKWYGWPDYSGDIPVADERLKTPGKERNQKLLQNDPGPQVPTAIFGVHSSADGFDFSRNPAFGHVGEAFVALFGDQAPAVGKILHPVGFKVVRVDVTQGTIEDFIVNRGETNGPASNLKSGGLERPVAVRFDPSGQTLYVVDFGILRMEDDGSAKPQPGTGALWRVTHVGSGRASR